MEYPIIDTLTNAYIRNGWTGLNIDYGVNRFNYDVFKTASIRRGTAIYENNGISLTATENDAYTVSYSDREFWIPVSPGDVIRIKWDAEYDVYGSVYLFSEPDNGVLTFKLSHTTPQVINYTIPSNIYYVAIRFGVTNAGTTIHFKDIMVTINEELPTDYIPYHPPKTDIFSRTRLPLIRYFPHPVIESLKRASDGTMTADDVQVLRHYLTKFGIGNIKLGRFHAIKPNISDDIKEIDLEPIPIDEPIKEKKKTGEEDLNVKTE